MTGNKQHTISGLVAVKVVCMTLNPNLHTSWHFLCLKSKLSF